MKYKVVILALFMAHWESISGCSGSKSPDGTVETTGRGLIGKKQLLCIVHGSSNNSTNIQSLYVHLVIFVTNKQVA